MKNTSALAFFLTALLLLAGCREHPSDDNRPLRARLAEDTETVLKEENGKNLAFLQRKIYDSVIVNCGELLRAFPARPAGNRDSVLLQTRLLLNTYRLGCIYAKRTAEGVALADSLLLPGHPYFEGQAVYDLLAVGASLRRHNHDNAGALRLAERFAALPRSADLTQEVFACDLVADVYNHCSTVPYTEIKMFERAVDAYRKGGKSKDPADLIGNLGYYYRRKGEYEKATEYIQEAADWCEAHPENLSPGYVYTCGNLGTLYNSLGMFDKALESFSRGIGYSLRLDSLVLSNLYRMKADTFWGLEERDSALFYIRQALHVAVLQQDRPCTIAAKRQLCTFYSEFFPDSALVALDGYRELWRDSASLTVNLRQSIRFHLGRSLAKTGNAGEGIPLMEQALREMRDAKWREMEEWGAHELLDIYAANRMDHKLAALYPAYIALLDSSQKADKKRYAIAANIRYEAGRKEQENRALNAEVELKERSLVYMQVILVLACCLLASAAAYLFQRRRQHRREREMHRNQLNSLLSAQQELNRRNEQLSHELEQAAHNEVIDNVRKNLDPKLLSGEDEMRFRQSFAAVCPRYLPELRARCPELTKSDELLCILIYMKLNTDEIALSLGISRASVNSGRSRIRKKFGLKKEDSLEECLGAYRGAGV